MYINVKKISFLNIVCYFYTLKNFSPSHYFNYYMYILISITAIFDFKVYIYIRRCIICTQVLLGVNLIK